jgi:hypothetical protein
MGGRSPFGEVNNNKVSIMVNFGLNSASILGIFLAVAGASLYFLRSVRPELSRDQDIFFAAVGLLCGLILLFQGWRLDPILQFGQFLLTGSTIFFAVEAIRMRGIATEQARRNTPIVDDERPVSRVYRAELDKLEPYEDEEEYDNPRLRGYQDSRSNRRTPSEEQSSRRSNRPRPSDPYNDYNSPSRSRRPRPTTSSQEDNYDSYSQERTDLWDERPSVEPRRRPSRPESSYRPTRRPRPSVDDEKRNRSRNEDIPTVDYVDYQPINPPENDHPSETKGDNPINFDY